MFNITQNEQEYNPNGKVKRLGIYSIKEDGKRVIKALSKIALGFRAKRVSNGPLFNNVSLTQGVIEGMAICTIGLLLKGTERKYEVPVVWEKDVRGNYRRYITKEQFKLLPELLQRVAKSRGVNVTGSLIIFSRCVAAWAGHNVTGMHVHHVNMTTTDDRLGNLWVLTPAQHSAVHSEVEALHWDEDWYEYTTMNVLERQFGLLSLGEADIAKDIAHKPVSLYLVEEDADWSNLYDYLDECSVGGAPPLAVCA